MKPIIEMTARIEVERGVKKPHIDMARLAIGILNNQLTGLKFNPVVNQSENDFRSLPTGQVDAKILEDYRSFGGSEYCMNMLLTSRDMSVEKLNYLFGCSKAGQGNLIVSSARLDKNHLGDPYEFLTTLVHEAGHSLGLVHESQPRHDHNSAFPGHCRNECIMRAANNLGDIQTGTRLLLTHIHSTGGFCEGCSSDLAKINS
jgi:predicted Zn-dependent protease